jgi:enoyl-CoA hydratase/carnithine racemase
MPYEDLLVDTTTDVATVTLNRPERLNAMSSHMLTELIFAASEIAASNARAVVISGAGRAFSAGVDLGLFTAAASEESLGSHRAKFVLGGDMADAIESIPQPIVVALHGHVVGGGVVLASACDLRIAAIDTTFSIPEIDLGISLGWGGIERLVREIGPARTREFVMTGRPFSAQEAQLAGLVNHVVPRDDVVVAATALATSIAAKSQFAIRATKVHVAEVLNGDNSRDDATTAAESMFDPESVSLREQYLERVSRKP